MLAEVNPFIIKIMTSHIFASYTQTLGERLSLNTKEQKKKKPKPKC